MNVDTGGSDLDVEFGAGGIYNERKSLVRICPFMETLKPGSYSIPLSTMSRILPRTNSFGKTCIYSLAWQALTCISRPRFGPPAANEKTSHTLATGRRMVPRVSDCSFMLLRWESATSVPSFKWPAPSPNHDIDMSFSWLAISSISIQIHGVILDTASPAPLRTAVTHFTVSQAQMTWLMGEVRTQMTQRSI